MSADDDDLDRLALARHRETYHELRLEQQRMSKSVPRPPDYNGPGDRRQLPAPSFEPGSLRPLVFGMIAFWLTVIGGIALLYSCHADAAGRQVYLEGEDDLGNGMKHCLYGEGVVITIPAHRLCPLSINVGD